MGMWTFFQDMYTWNLTSIFYWRSVILELPPIESETITVKFTDGERAFYSSLLLRSQAIFDGYVRNGTASRSLIQIFSLLQKLRQACDHLALTVAPRITDIKAISRKMPNPRTSESVKQDTCKHVPKNVSIACNDLMREKLSILIIFPFKSIWE